MNHSYLKKLEDLFLAASDLKSDVERQEFVARVSRSDPELGAELRNVLLLQHESEELLHHPRDDYVSLLCATLGEQKREETSEELLQFLQNLGPPRNSGDIATLQNFDLTELVATGATGFLFKARDTSLNRNVAVKFLAPSIAAHVDRCEAFVSESRLASSISNDHVVRIHHTFFDSTNVLAYYVMEWIHGTSLQRWLDQNKSGPPHQIGQFFDQICEGVAAIHEQGIIHRDLTPGNIMIEDDSNRLVIVDFGIALDGGTQSATGLPIGTPLYMSPEQFNCEPITKASDLFSLGEIACVLFCGSHPFAGQSLAELMENVFSSQPAIPETRDFNDAQRNALTTALQQDPAKRQASVRKFHDQFREINGTVPRGTQSNAAFSTRDVLVQWPRVIGKNAWIASVLTALLLLISYWAIMPFIDRSALDANTDVQTTNDVSQGIWLDANHYRNGFGMSFRHLKTNPITVWPPSDENPEWYRELGWPNFGNRNILIGKNLVTNSVFQDVIGLDPPAALDPDQNPDAPATNISLDEAEDFCRKLTLMDPDGLEYHVCSSNEWTYAVYGHSLLSGLVTPQEQTEWFQAKAAGMETEGAEYSAINDALMGHFEWTSDSKLDIGNENPSPQYGDLEQVSGVLQHEILGGTTSNLFLHPFDALSGMSDYLVNLENLELHTEDDGNTVYLKPIVTGETGSLIHRYVFQGDVTSARLWDPIFVYSENATAGIQFRCSTSANPEDIANLRWNDLATYVENNTHFNRLLDLTTHIQGARLVEVRYWVQSADLDTSKLQIARTTPTMKFGRDPFRGFTQHYGIEIVTQRRSESPRESVKAPRTFRSPHVSFRVCISPSNSVMENRPSQ